MGTEEVAEGRAEKLALLVWEGDWIGGREEEQRQKNGKGPRGRFGGRSGNGGDERMGFCRLGGRDQWSARNWNLGAAGHLGYAQIGSDYAFNFFTTTLKKLLEPQEPNVMQ